MKKQLLTLTLAFASMLGYSQQTANTWHSADECLHLVNTGESNSTYTFSEGNPAANGVNASATNVSSIAATLNNGSANFDMPTVMPGESFSFNMKYYTENTGSNNTGSGRLIVRIYNSTLGSGSNAIRVALPTENKVGGVWTPYTYPSTILAANTAVTDAGGFDRILIIASNNASTIEPLYIDDLEFNTTYNTNFAVLSSTDATLAAGNHFYYNNSPDDFASTISAFSGATTFSAAQATPTTTGNSSPTVLKVTKNEGDPTTGIEFNAGPGFEIDEGDGKITVRIYPECNLDYANPTLRTRARADGAGGTQIQHATHVNLTPNQWNEVSLDLNDVANQSATTATSYNEVYLIFNQGDSSDTSGANPAVFYIDGLQTPSTSGILSTNDIDAQGTGINVYPNPVNGSFTISSNEAVKTVQVYSISGSLLKTFNGQPSYDISDLTSGIYFINTGSKTVKIVKN